MTVLEELLNWSQGRPAWQRDALRRLALNDDLSEDDIRALTDICKSAHGLAEQQDIAPFTKEHVPEKTAGNDTMTIIEVTV
jgi:Cdc6-like AAA superfamily ATPase